MVGLTAPAQRFNDLFGAEGNEHPDHDNPNLASKLAPAVQRLR
jgi:hypothetical protein